MPFDVREGDGGKPVISVDVNGEKKDFAQGKSPPWFSKDEAAARRGSACRSPRLSSPSRPTSTTPSVVKQGCRCHCGSRRLAYHQRADRRRARAVSIAAKRRRGHQEPIILVFDLGGGTFDVSLLNLQDGVFEVLSTAGDTHLGGEDFDTQLAAFAQKEIEKGRGSDIFAGDDKALRKLRTACEAKRELSVANHANIECFIGEVEINMKVTREQFEKVSNRRSTLHRLCQRAHRAAEEGRGQRNRPRRWFHSRPARSRHPHRVLRRQDSQQVCPPG